MNNLPVRAGIEILHQVSLKQARHPLPAKRFIYINTLSQDKTTPNRMLSFNEYFREENPKII